MYRPGSIKVVTGEGAHKRVKRAVIMLGSVSFGPRVQSFIGGRKELRHLIADAKGALAEMGAK
jgi:hypothetical protein